MKDKIKKILTASSLMVITLGAVGCSESNQKIAKNIDRSMSEFVSCLNNLDYVSASASAVKPEFSKEVLSQGKDRKVGKIVETAASPAENTAGTDSDSQSQSNNGAQSNGDSQSQSNSGAQTEGVSKYKITKLIMTERVPVEYIGEGAYSEILERTLTFPAKSGHSNLFVLSSTPFITFTSNNDAISSRVAELEESIESESSSIDEKINTLILRRSILMIYVNEIYNGNVELSEENKLAINAYVNVIKENTSFLRGNRGMVKNQLKLASDLNKSGENDRLIGYYMIKSKEALEVRSNKLDSAISAIDSIIDILESNLTEKSPYYNKNLSSSYQNLVQSINSNELFRGEVSKVSTNKEVADKILSSLHFKTIIKKDNKNLQNDNNNNVTISQKNANLYQNNQKNTSKLSNKVKNQNSALDESGNQNASKDADKSVLLKSENKSGVFTANGNKTVNEQRVSAQVEDNDKLIRINTGSNLEVDRELNRTSAAIDEAKPFNSLSANHSDNLRTVEGEPNIKKLEFNRDMSKNSRNPESRLQTPELRDKNSRPQTLELRDENNRPQIPEIRDENNRPQTLELKDEGGDRVEKNRLHRVSRGGKTRNINRSNSNMESEKIMRADRNPQKQTLEQYSNTDTRGTAVNRVKNMPFRTDHN